MKSTLYRKTNTNYKDKKVCDSFYLFSWTLEMEWKNIDRKEREKKSEREQENGKDIEIDIYKIAFLD